MRPNCLLPFVFSVLGLYLCPSVQAQKPEDILKHDLKDKPLVLRNLSGATKIHGSWDGQAALIDRPPFHMYAAVTPTWVQLKGSQVSLGGERRLIVRDKSGHWKLGDIATNVEITISLLGDPATLVPEIRRNFFFANFDEALLVVPKTFRVGPDTHVVASSEPELSTSQCDCAGADGHCLDMNQPGFTHPKLLSSIDPNISEEAKQKNISGTVFVGIRISDKGDIADEWLIQDLGYGLDEEAISAVRRYKFAPASCHGTSISSNVAVSVDFQNFR